MKLKSASAYRLRDRYLICPNIRTTTGLWMNSAPYVTLPLDADPRLIGKAILTALEGSTQGAPHPTDFRAASELRRSAAGVRSERQFQLGATYIGISIDGDNLRLLPYRNGGSKGDQKGFYPSHEQERFIEMRSGADEVGAMFMEVLSSLQGIPAISPKATVLGGMDPTPNRFV